MASATAASVPGRMGIHSSAFSAAPDICGSKFTSLQPFLRLSAKILAVMPMPWRVATPAWVPNCIRYLQLP